MEGWILLHRKLQDCEIWANSQPFDMRSAWVDLLLLANHRDVEIVFDYTPMTVKRGQYLTSVRKLCARWNWSKNRTLKYLRLLESLKMISRESNAKRTLITIENYDVYQDVQDTNEDTGKDTGEYTKRTQSGHKADTSVPQTNNEKNDNNEKEIYNYPSDSSSDYTSDTQKILTLWNELGKYGIPTVKVVAKGSNRETQLKSRLKQFGVVEFENAINQIHKSSFLKGQNKNGWTITFDWFIKPSNFAKVLEGNYSDERERERDSKNVRSIQAGVEEYTSGDEKRDRQIDEIIRRIESGEADHDDDGLWDWLDKKP